MELKLETQRDAAGMDVEYLPHLEPIATLNIGQRWQINLFHSHHIDEYCKEAVQ